MRAKPGFSHRKLAEMFNVRGEEAQEAFEDWSENWIAKNDVDAFISKHEDCSAPHV